jgi:hypothetical protein
MDDVAAIIRSIARNPELVHVDSPESYTGFGEGRTLFDISPHGERLRVFMEKNRSEFGDAAFRLAPDGAFRWFQDGDIKVHVLYHKHKSAERIFSSPTMRQLEQEHPELFSD